MHLATNSGESVLQKNVLPNNIELISPSSLNTLFSSSSTKLLMDLRPTELYITTHITGSISLTIPSTLLKRTNTKLSTIRNFIKQEDRCKFDIWNKVDYLILVDLKDGTPLNNVTNLAMKFDRKVYYLTSINTFILKYKKFLQFTSTSNNSEEPSGLLRLNDLKSTYLNTGALTVPIKQLNNTSNNLLYNSIMQYNTANTSNEEMIKVDLSPLKLKENVPSFIKEMNDDLIKERFRILEEVERDRIKIMVASMANNNNTTCKYSIREGIEKVMKNRYSNIWPYEYNRIKLKNNNDDYINASLICENYTGNQYIATQGPLQSTFADFWALVWQQKTRVVVMLTRVEEGGRVRCHQYWPDTTNIKMNIENKYNIILLKTNKINNAEIVVRKFLVRNLEHRQNRTVVQIHYFGWPDYGTPQNVDQILLLLNIYQDYCSMATKKDKKSKGPSIVHCSAGCGRTGTFILLDCFFKIIKNNIQYENDLVFSIAEKLRDQRISMVQTYRQYAFCYQAAVHYLTQHFSSKYTLDIDFMFDDADINFMLDSKLVFTATSSQQQQQPLVEVRGSSSESYF